MKLTEEKKNAIESEFKQWTEIQYASKSLTCCMRNM